MTSLSFDQFVRDNFDVGPRLGASLDDATVFCFPQLSGDFGALSLISECVNRYGTTTDVVVVENHVDDEEMMKEGLWLDTAALISSFKVGYLDEGIDELFVMLLKLNQLFNIHLKDMITSVDKEEKADIYKKLTELEVVRLGISINTFLDSTSLVKDAAMIDGLKNLALTNQVLRAHKSRDNVFVMGGLGCEDHIHQLTGRSVVTLTPKLAKSKEVGAKFREVETAVRERVDISRVWELLPDK